MDYPYISLDHIIFSLQTAGGISRWWANHCENVFQTNLSLTKQYGCYKNSNIYFDIIKNKILASKSELNLRVVPSLWYVRPIKLTSDIRLHHASYYRPIRKLSQNTKIITTFHDSHSMRQSTFASFIKKRVFSSCLYESDAIHCVSKFAANQLLSLFPTGLKAKLHVVYHGFSITQESHPIELPRSFPLPYVLWVGKRSDYKNGKIAFEAIKKLPNCSLVLAGGEQLSKVESCFLHDNNLTHRVLHFKKCTDEQLRWLYENAVCLWYPSAEEGFGFPLLEAIAYNCPVLASSGHAVEEIGKDFAFFSSTPSGAWLAETTLSILRGNHSLMSKGSIASFLNRFTWDRYASEMRSIYTSFL